MFDRYYCINTEDICYISRYFLHYFVSPFHRCLANAISTDNARSRSGHYTSRNGSESVAAAGEGGGECTNGAEWGVYPYREAGRRRHPAALRRVTA